MNTQLSAQQIDSLSNTIKYHSEGRALLKKADRQKTIAKVLAGGSLVLNVICVVEAATHNLDGLFGNWDPFAQDLPTNTSSNNSSSNYKGSKLLFVGAIALVAGSITYGFLAKKNKKTARMMLGSESVFFNPDLNLKERMVSLGIKITL